MRQAVGHSCIIISIIICACVSCYCKNHISASEISPITHVRRREMAFPSPRNPKVSPLNVRPPQTFTSGYTLDHVYKIVIIYVTGGCKRKSVYTGNLTYNFRHIFSF